MIKLAQGDMFTFPADIRINTVNCVGVMGKGVALVFKKRQPDMFKEYAELCKRQEIAPGKLHVWKDQIAGEITVNLPTKRHWRNNSQYKDIEVGLIALRKFLEDFEGSTITLPALGCGHGGLDWKRVQAMIEHFLKDLNATILVFQPSDSQHIDKKDSQKKTDEQDDILLITSRSHTNIEEDAIRQHLIRELSPRKSISISASSPFLKAVYQIVTEKNANLRIWGRTDMQFGTDLTHVHIEDVTADDAIRIAITQTLAILVSDPNPTWLKHFAENVKKAIFQIEYPQCSLRSLGGQSLDLLLRGTTLPSQPPFAQKSLS